LYYLPFVLIIALGILQVYFSNSLSCEGRSLKDLENKIEAISEENDLLKGEIVSYGGLSSLKEKAEELGYIEKPRVVNLTGEMPVALNP